MISAVVFTSAEAPCPPRRPAAGWWARELPEVKTEPRLRSGLLFVCGVRDISEWLVDIHAAFATGDRRDGARRLTVINPQQSVELIQSRSFELHCTLCGLNVTALGRPISRAWSRSLPSHPTAVIGGRPQQASYPTSDGAPVSKHLLQSLSRGLFHTRAYVSSLSFATR